MTALHPQEIRTAYARGENISALLRARALNGLPSEETIEVSYDLQAGDYIRAVQQPPLRDHKVRYAQRIATLLGEFGAFDSLLEPGVGEATTLSFVLDALPRQPRHVHGFDLSWSRAAAARRWLAAQGRNEVFLCVACLSRIPYQSGSFDVVLTSHALEPNRGQEATLLQELYRVASRYLVLLEPAYELAGAAERARMDQHGYCRDLAGTAARLGMQVLRHELLGESANPANPTGLTIIAKAPSAPSAVPRLICPCHGDELEPSHGAYYSRASMRVYPILRGVPCLRPEKAMIASKFADEMI